MSPLTQGLNYRSACDDISALCQHLIDGTTSSLGRREMSEFFLLLLMVLVLLQ